MPVAKIYNPDTSEWIDVLAASDGSIPKSVGTEKGALVGFSAAGTPVEIPAAPDDGYSLTSDTTQTGGVKWSKRPIARIHQTGTQNITQGTPTQATGSTVTFETRAGMADAANNRILIPETGLYRVAGLLTWASSVANIQVLGTLVYVNGSSRFEASRPYLASSHGAIGPPITDILSLSAGDAVTLWAYWWNGGGGGVHSIIGSGINYYRYLEVEYLGPA